MRDRIDVDTAAADLAPVVESTRIQSGTSVVLIADLDHTIVAATDPTLVGTRLTLPDDSAWGGRAWDGDLALAGDELIVAGTPVFATAESGDPAAVGLAVVGEAYPSAWSSLVSDVPEVAFLLGLASLAGLTGSFLLARRIKKQTRGLEPAEIATLNGPARRRRCTHPRGGDRRRPGRADHHRQRRRPRPAGPAGELRRPAGRRAGPGGRRGRRPAARSRLLGALTALVVLGPCSRRRR